MKILTLTKPDDWHLHLRDGEFLTTTVPLTAERFARAIVMPNLKPPIITVADAQNYHQRIRTAIPTQMNFTPLMTLYLTETMDPKTISTAKQSGFVVAGKLYPKGATTHSQAGVSNMTKMLPIFAAMEENNFPLLVHAESMANNIDVFDREQCFLDNELQIITKKFPQLRIVIEHLSSSYGVAWVLSASKNIAATITAHHLLLTRNDLLSNGIHPHYYCLPIVKTEKDREALLSAATSGNPKFFLGTDSAPHAQSVKESACGAAGIFTSHAALEIYAEIFAQANALDKLEGFASFYGADFYQMPRNSETITLVKEDWQIPEAFPFGNEQLKPFLAGRSVSWKLQRS
jgi:dihydroorotase